mgnify:CR=1 FL=1
MKGPSKYHDVELVRRRVALGEHRDVIGGLWEELGELQKQFLIKDGLKPHHRVLDVGCGSLRAGVRLAPWLEPGRYFGIDLRAELLDAGYDAEIAPQPWSDRLPRSNLHATEAFDATGFGVLFDVGLAQSVFTHLPAGELKKSLVALAPVFKPGAKYYITYFERPDGANEQPFRHASGIDTFSDRDPFDMSRADLQASVTPDWRLEIIGDWGHPRGQSMARFIRRG